MCSPSKAICDSLHDSETGWLGSESYWHEARNWSIDGYSEILLSRAIRKTGKNITVDTSSLRVTLSTVIDDKEDYLFARNLVVQ